MYPEVQIGTRERPVYGMRRAYGLFSRLQQPIIMAIMMKYALTISS